MLVIELDGSQHTAADAQQYDAARTDILEAMGLRVLRFDNRQVLQELEAVIEVIHAEAEGRLGRIPPSPPFSKGGAESP
jgi:very-short-patch-repair endonuclease